MSLAGNNGEQFRGVFVQARLMADDTTRVGTFAVSDSSSSDTELSACPINTVSNAAYNTVSRIIVIHPMADKISITYHHNTAIIII